MKNYFSAKILALFTLPAFCGPLSGQSISVDYGSFFSGSDGLFFANASGQRFDTGNDAVIAVGYFGNAVANSTFSEYLADFNLVTSSNFSGNATSPGYYAAGDSGLSGPAITAATGEVPYVMIFAGINDFSNASSATEYIVYRDTGWATFPVPDVSDPTLNLQTYQPDTIVIGSLNNVADGFEMNTVAVPEPSHFALAFGLIGLGVVVWRRRRKAVADETAE
jgi:hypothetical protein